MKTIILAAGEGTRLRPYTSDRPKCMVSLAGRPLIYWQLACLRACDVDEPFVLVGGYQIERIVAPSTIILKNPAFSQTNMVSTLFCARAHMRSSEDLLIAYGDIVYEPRVVRSLLEADAPICIAADRRWKDFWSLRMEDPLADAETFKMDEAGRVLELGRKPKTYNDVEAQYMGLIRIRKDYVRAFLEHYDMMDRHAVYDGKNFENMYMTSLLQNLIDNGWLVNACLVDNGWLEVDTAQELEHYQQMYDNGTLTSFCDLSTIL